MHLFVCQTLPSLPNNPLLCTSSTIALFWLRRLTFVFTKKTPEFAAICISSFEIGIEINARTACAGGVGRWSELVEHGGGQLPSAVGQQVGRGRSSVHAWKPIGKLVRNNQFWTSFYLVSVLWASHSFSGSIIHLTLVFFTILFHVAYSAHEM
jgi:hypothetical protein